MPKNHVRIEVFVSKTGSVRAKVSGERYPAPVEVTVGGESWKAGKLQEHHERILKQAKGMLYRAFCEIHKLQTGEDIIATLESYNIPVPAVVNQNPEEDTGWSDKMKRARDGARGEQVYPFDRGNKSRF